MKSLRRRLVVILLVLTVFTWLVTVAVTGLNAQQLLRDQIDQQLIEYMDVSIFTSSAIIENESNTCWAIFQLFWIWGFLI